MSQGTRRERIRAATEMEIREHARALLVTKGRDAVTLRAIARELGITAPALYRYYDSREDLLRQLGDDICTDLVTELTERVRGADPADFRGKLNSVCHGFRRWALAHPKEFALVFATRADETSEPEGGAAHPDGSEDRFASVFMRIIGPLMVEATNLVNHEAAPAGLHGELASNQQALAHAFSDEGIEMPAEALDTTAVFVLLRWWVRLYGHVALEVFGRFPFTLVDSDLLYESLLDELAKEIGIA
ncbi:TetR/AcrR family transcriptional regulator [Saccharopolyspora gloriosae]|uniref:AcrR family transcriptional regulator n=1 Tax=Saccharopolyspora gloriosae TaxID=455344 RepID=A0A840NQG0_9PSEU|nr:WHG domain-containing protein [Saccharopolyspora gloriosae]MBB5072598.1 AcrR family transcriptional regulator [Saccharopolyspora gloriosae]